MHAWMAGRRGAPAAARGRVGTVTEPA
eukprot:SAG31_NODE_5509_length_2491_cov_1.987040_1_plen_26_part_10